ncbi:MAG: SDR family NAD(P)-dependent oxidoreductase [Pseudomonadota bacterium]
MTDAAKTALVTGANRGIGAAIADGLAAAGFTVHAGVRNPEDYAGRHHPVAIDLTAPENVVLTAPYDVLVNNAGVLWDDRLFDDPSHFETSVDVMLRGPYHLIGQCLSHMEQHGGRIINISSGWGSFSEGLGGGGAYAIAKAALNALTVIADRDTGPNVCVNTMCPGWVRTRMGGAAATRSVNEGADTALWLATVDPSPSGKFFRDRQEINW